MQVKVPESEEIKFRAIRNDDLINNDESNQSSIVFNLQDVNVFTVIYKKLFPSVYYYAKRFVTSEEAQDLTADVFTKLWNTDKKFSSIPSIKNYLQVSVRNAAINYNEHQRIIEKNKDNIVSLNDSIDYRFNEYDEIKAEKIKLIFAAIGKLPLQQKKVFELFYFGGLKEKEIALKLDIAIRTVHNNKMLAKKNIRFKLGSLFIVIIFFIV
jgi:RNA polymerase sigma-19 factor, ECF subfamily